MEKNSYLPPEAENFSANEEESHDTEADQHLNVLKALSDEELDTRIDRASDNPEAVAVLTDLKAERLRLRDESNASRSQKLGEIVKGLSGAESDEELLHRLGMLEYDDENTPRFTFPTGLFTRETEEKWENYMSTVRKSVGVANIAKSMNLPMMPKDWEVIEEIRDKAHGEVAKSIWKEMGADRFWKVEQARRLAAKMRDYAIPNSGEIALTAPQAKYFIDEAWRKHQRSNI